MELRKADQLLQMWQRALNQGENLVLMRHGPKSGSNESGLSKQGEKLTSQYAGVLEPLWLKWLSSATLIRTSKARTKETLKLLFPKSSQSVYKFLPGLDSPPVSDELQQQANQLHTAIGRWRGYFLNHTYYFLEELGGKYPVAEENLRTLIAEKAASGIRTLLEEDRLTVFCGHSPSLEAGIIKVLGISLSELGGFLNPLDSIHLVMNSGRVKWVVRINPIRGYIDLESETYFQ